MLRPVRCRVLVAVRPLSVSAGASQSPQFWRMTSMLKSNPPLRYTGDPAVPTEKIAISIFVKSGAD